MAITPGAGGSCGSTVGTISDVICSIPLTSQAGDLAVIASAARASMTFSGMCGATVVNRGAVPTSTAFLMTAENLTNCSEALSVVAAGTGTAVSFALLAQVYSGATLRSFQLAASAATLPDNPSLAPVVNVQVPGSMVVAAFYGTPASVTFTPTIRTRFNLSAGALVITDSIANIVGPYQMPLLFSGTGCVARWVVLLEPVPVAGVQVIISPTSATVTSGAIEQFIATVTGSPNTAVTWTASVGSVDATGLYTAPTVFQPATGTITATSVADPTQSANAVLYILPAETLVQSPFGGGYRRFIRRKPRGAVWS